MGASAASGARGAALFPALFVLLWSTGFIAAKFGLPYAPPFSFLFWRFLLVSVLMALLAFVTGARRPRSLAEWRDLALVALGVHALYLGGVFVSLDGGMAAGTSAMLVGMQPILTVVLARFWLDEPVHARQWAGLALGIAGVWCVVRLKIDFAGRRAAVQYAVCAVVFAPLAWLVDARPVQWVPSFVFALSWSVLVLSVGAITLLYWLLRHGAAANVARLFYLVPPVTAVMAWLLFGETLDALAIAGMALICVGVVLARRPA